MSSKRVPLAIVQTADNTRSKSLNRRVRQQELVRITTENETLLQRLQQKTSHYNVFEWELQRKKQEKMLKKICYYPPSLIQHKRPSRMRSRRARIGVPADPNREIYQYYQNNVLKNEDTPAKEDNDILD